MRFIAVERAAAQEIISDRVMQTVEYEGGRTLAALLQEPSFDVNLGPRIVTQRQKNGLFLLAASAELRDWVVFDLETTGLFKCFPSTGALLCFQKILRFSVKYWENLKLSVCERVLPGSTKAIVFPFPISQQTNCRVSIELAPDSRRQARRCPEGRILLVYRCGIDEGGGPQEDVSLTNFRQFLDARQSVAKTHDGNVSGANQGITALAVTALEQVPQSRANPYQGYERWVEILTERQKQFVLGVLSAPHRIEGPAGTGKTLCLILKSITGLRNAEHVNKEHRALFVTHSEATRRTVQQLIEATDPSSFLCGREELRPQNLQLVTLQHLCGELLRKEIAESEFLDRDAMESKQLQLLYVEEALKQTLTTELPTYKPFLSASFAAFLSKEERWAIAEMLQHEISVVIKGRANEKLENYRSLPRLKYGLPTSCDGDRGFVWHIFKKYQEQLRAAAQFDTDDIVLTTIGQLDTPIWRRRREREGYHSIYIDETHLFNINELSLFHYLTRSIENFPIAYSVDRSQAVGDRGWTDELVEETLSPSSGAYAKAEKTEVKGIFRCSPDIVNFAFSITSSGATLFTNFQDPLKVAVSMFTADEERKATLPTMISCANDDDMIARTFSQAQLMVDDLQAHRCDVAVVAFSDELFKQMGAYAKEVNKPVEVLKQRGDTDAVRRAKDTQRFLLSTPEYVGGLEFEGVILVGVDEGRVPPTRTDELRDSASYLSYNAHNRLYVAITRAKYRIEVLTTIERGPSALLRPALATGMLRDANG